MMFRAATRTWYSVPVDRPVTFAVTPVPLCVTPVQVAPDAAHSVDVPSQYSTT